MNHIGLQLTLFRRDEHGRSIEADRLRSEQSLLRFLRALAAHNLDLMRMYGAPKLYSAGVRYRREPKRTEMWRDARWVLEHGHGDCEDLSAYLAAERVLEGDRKARPAIRGRWIDGKWTYHVVVRRGDGRIEDPSRVLGMNARAFA